ncbi:MAG TPA: hypothetical protein VGR19_00825 [Allosphingosinicella sp.]|nr:hypothetical protein [Allosphingosinicella sp.]
MLKMKALIAASLLLGTPALAQQGVPAGASESGKRIVQENFKKRDATLAPLMVRKRELQRQFDALLTPQGYDEQKLAATMAEMRKVEGEIVETSGTSLLALLKELPAEDRSRFLTSLKRGPAPRRAPGAGTGR